MQEIASKNNFRVAMMYDEADEEEGATRPGDRGPNDVS